MSFAATKTASDAVSKYEQVSCGCDGQRPVNVPHFLIERAVAERLSPFDTAKQLAGNHRGRQMAVITAAQHMWNTKILELLPEGWPEP